VIPRTLSDLRRHPRPRRMAALVAMLALAILTSTAGCAATGLSRDEMDAALQADCMRSGGSWYGSQQFGGNCLYRGPSR
jgi:hypothetical protein